MPFVDGIKKLAPKKGTRTYSRYHPSYCKKTPSNHFIDITTRLKPAYLYSISLVPVAARGMNSKLHWYGAGSQSPACTPCRPFTIFTTSRSKHFSLHFNSDYTILYQFKSRAMCPLSAILMVLRLITISCR